jgi:hypothetical protein
MQLTLVYKGCQENAIKTELGGIVREGREDGRIIDRGMWVNFPPTLI